MRRRLKLDLDLAKVRRVLYIGLHVLVYLFIYLILLCFAVLSTFFPSFQETAIRGGLGWYSGEGFTVIHLNEDEGFREFVNKLDHTYVLPTRQVCMWSLISTQNIFFNSFYSSFNFISSGFNGGRKVQKVQGESQGPGHESRGSQSDSRYVNLNEYGRLSCSHMPFLKWGVT